MRRRQIRGNLTPKMALDALPALAIARDRAEQGDRIDVRTLRRIEELLANHVKAAVERGRRR
jgi:hypothetical protein